MKHKCTNIGCDYYRTTYPWNCSKIQEVESCRDASYCVLVEGEEHDVLKRYEINIIYDHANNVSLLSEKIAPDGQWHKHEDVEKLKADHAEEIKGLLDTCALGVDAVECNCEEESIKKAEDRNKRNTKRNNGKRNHGCSR